MMTDSKGRKLVELPTSPEGGTTTYRLGTMTPEQARTFAEAPGPGEWYAAHRDETLKDGPVGDFTLLLGDGSGKLRPVTVRPDGTRVR